MKHINSLKFYEASTKDESTKEIVRRMAKAFGKCVFAENMIEKSKEYDLKRPDDIIKSYESMYKNSLNEMMRRLFELNKEVVFLDSYISTMEYQEVYDELFELMSVA